MNQNLPRVESETTMDRLKPWILGVLDILTVIAAYFFALLLRFDFRYSAVDKAYLMGYFHTIPIWCVATVVVFYIFHLYQSVWTYAGLAELWGIIKSYLVLGAATLLYVILAKVPALPRSCYIMGILINFCMSAGIRFSYRFLVVQRQLAHQKDKKIQKRVMIIGAGAAGVTLIRELQNTDRISSQVCCVIDDNPYKKGKYLEGVEIVGNRYDIVNMAKKYRITHIIFAIPTCNAEDKQAILNLCKETNCKLQIIPGMYQLLNEEVSVSKLRDVELQDLLGRDPIQVNLEEICRYISGKVVMVTGGGGSIGSELCRQIAKSNPEQLIIFDIYENNAYDIQMELRHTHPELNLEVLIGSVRDMGRLDDVMAKYRPELVFHAAAHKHVPLMEDSPNEAIKNNVFGTYKMAMASVKYGVKKFVLISTDKAVNPTNIMGASKRLCEMVVQMMNRRSPNTDFVAVRFGNVLGSNGSVIPLFKKQIAEGGPVTVTHPEITRFFMTIPEAVSLVLQAGYYAKGGEIFILDMGQPVKIDTMARNLIRLSGHEPDVDIKIVYTGLRPGEKLYEEILMAEEGLQETSNKLIHIGKPIVMDDEEFCHQLDRLEKACEEETEDMKDIVASVVPTYHRKK